MNLIEYFVQNIPKECTKNFICNNIYIWAMLESNPSHEDTPLFCKISLNLGFSAIIPKGGHLVLN